MCTKVNELSHLHCSISNFQTIDGFTASGTSVPEVQTINTTRTQADEFILYARKCDTCSSSVKLKDLKICGYVCKPTTTQPTGSTTATTTTKPTVSTTPGTEATSTTTAPSTTQPTASTTQTTTTEVTQTGTPRSTTPGSTTTPGM